MFSLPQVRCVNVCSQSKAREKTRQTKLLNMSISGRLKNIKTCTKLTDMFSFFLWKWHSIMTWVQTWTEMASINRKEAGVKDGPFKRKLKVPLVPGLTKGLRQTWWSCSIFDNNVIWLHCSVGTDQWREWGSCEGTNWCEAAGWTPHSGLKQIYNRLPWRTNDKTGIVIMDQC